MPLYVLEYRFLHLQENLPELPLHRQLGILIELALIKEAAVVVDALLAVLLHEPDDSMIPLGHLLHDLFNGISLEIVEPTKSFHELVRPRRECFLEFVRSCEVLSRGKDQPGDDYLPTDGIPDRIPALMDRIAIVLDLDIMHLLPIHGPLHADLFTFAPVTIKICNDPVEHGKPQIHDDLRRIQMHTVHLLYCVLWRNLGHVLHSFTNGL